MKRLLLFSAGLLLLIAMTDLKAQPTWQATFQTIDAPLTTACDGGDPLARVSVFVYLDLDSSGADTTDPLPWCLWLPGSVCIPEDPVFSFRNFPTEANGTINSPVFEGWSNVNPPRGTLRVYLRVFFGADQDSCYTSPVAELPAYGGLTEVVFARDQWQCGSAPRPRPQCHGDRLMGEVWDEPGYETLCVTTCDGGRMEFAARSDTSLWRPPVIRVTGGCGDSCEPSPATIDPASWFRLSLTHWWWFDLISPDYGCVTVQLLDSIPFARLDTLIVVVSDDNAVDLHWNTAWEINLDEFDIWQLSYGWWPRGELVGRVAAANNPTGAAYGFTHENAFGEGETRAYYLLVMMAADASEIAAGRVLAERTAGTQPEPPAIPEHFTLSAFPNPFNPATTLAFNLAQPQHIQLAVFDLTGRQVAVLANRLFPAGEHQLRFDASALPSGLYFARVQTGEFTVTQKLLLLK